MWLGSFQNGVFIVDKETGDTEQIQFPFLDPKLPYGKSVPLITADSSGNLWMSYSGYLYVREKGEKSLTPIKMPVPSDALQSPQMNSLIQYGNGWLIGTNIGLYFTEKKGANYAIRHIKGYGQSKVIDLWVASDGKVWVVPESDGLMMFDRADDQKAAGRIFRGLNVKSIEYDDTHKLLWISTSDGLIAYYILDGRHRFYTESSGLLSGFVFGIVRSGDAVWASTSKGLSTGNLQFKKDSTFPDINFVNYTVAEGLPLNEFNTGAFYKGKTGTLYFGSTTGVVWFDPGNIKAKFVRPNIHLTSFLANEKRADSLVAPEYISSVHLPYDRNTLFFQFSGIDFNNASKVRYRYQLAGWDRDWVYSNTLNEVRYNNLPHGEYVFKVMSTGSSGIWSDIRSVSVHISAPIWRTWWFYFLLASVIVLAIVLVTRFYAQQELRIKVAGLEKQKELEKERHRISREMHDEIGSGLTQIVLMSESVKNHTDSIREKVLSDITGTSRELVNNMSEIIWSLGAENKTLDQLCGYLREQLNRQLEYTGIDYHIELPENSVNINLSNEQRRNILLVTKEITNNAVKYSKANRLFIRAFINGDRLVFDVKDDGVGFQINEVKRGNGLQNIRSRIEELGGKVEIKSAPGEGTGFSYFIPLEPTI
jgi:signal transduction histidine kinase